jgi:hypothetical protein
MIIIKQMKNNNDTQDLKPSNFAHYHKYYERIIMSRIGLLRWTTEKELLS